LADYTREEFIEKFGYDPDTAVADEQPQEGEGLLKRYGRAAAVGAATIPTDLLALPDIVYQGGKALVSGDKPFMEQFGENIQVEGAADNVRKHLTDIVTAWQQQNPQLSQQDIERGLEDYQKTKEFEDFKNEQLKGGAWLATTAKNTVRKFLGDTRTEEQRPWTESVAEIAGGAIVPGTAATKAASALTRGVVESALASSKLARGAARTVEVLTPLTTPYTPGNIALNTAVGTGIDQALRVAQGKESAFTPKDEDTAGVGTLATIAGGGAAAAAFIGAVRGKSNVALQASQTRKALEAHPPVDIRVPAEPKTGQAGIESTVEQQLNPPSYIEQQPWYKRPMQRLANQFVDQGAGLDAVIRQERGYAEAQRFEGIRTTNTGAVLNDTVYANTNTSLRDLVHAVDQLAPEERRAVQAGMQMSSYAAHLGVVEQTTLDRLSALQQRLNKASNNLQRSRIQKEFDQLTNDYSRFKLDDPSARPMLPELPMAQVKAIAKAFENDTTPGVVKVREALKAWGDEMLKLQVQEGKMSAAYAASLRSRNPYYVPVINDPLKGATGFNRLYKSITESITRRMSKQSEGTGGAVLRETPIQELSKEIPAPRTNALAPESRVTTPLHPLSSIRFYTERAYRDVAHTHMRNEYLRTLAKLPDGKDTAFVRDGHMRVVRFTAPGSGGRFSNKTWHAADELGSPLVREAAESPRVVPEWQNGRVRLWEFGDLEHAAMLRAEPVVLNGLMKALNTTSRFFKFFTTGKGNPVFAVKGALYDLTIGLLTHSANRAFGPLSTGLRHILPESLARHTIGRIPDPTAIAAPVYHAMRSVIDTTVNYVAHATAQTLARENAAFGAMRQVLGPKLWNDVVAASTKVALWTDNFKTMQLMRAGVAHGVTAVDDISKVRGAWAISVDSIPKPLRAAWQFYGDLVNSIYLAPKRMFYTENYGLLYRKYNGNIPKQALDQLIHETRTIGGDMSKIPASKLMRDAEMIFPYLTQTKLGTYHLYRNMFHPQLAQYVLPRMAIAMYGVGASYYMMTYWDEGSREEFWKRMADYERWRVLFLPTPQLATMWARGERPAYDRSLVHKLTLPPDIAPIVAGTAAFMQSLGMLPADALPKPISKSLPNVLLDSLTPAMPPALQALLGAFGYKLDPQSADTRGGNWIRNYNQTFRSGPQAEAATNLGEVSNSTSLMLNALFGSMGANVAGATDVLIHASKFHPSLGAGNVVTMRQAQDFSEGLRAATTELFKRSTANVPDVVPVWGGKPKYMTMTSAYTYVRENNEHIRSIAGMRDNAVGKAAALRRQQAAQVGGVPQQALVDASLIQLAQDVYRWQGAKGDLGLLRKEYKDLATMSGSLRMQYQMPQEEKQRRMNEIIKRQQDNMEQQHLAIKYFEQEATARYGPYLKQQLGGRPLSLSVMDQLMRDSLGNPAYSQSP
jgi:hypothetical protein